MLEKLKADVSVPSWMTLTVIHAIWPKAHRDNWWDKTTYESTITEDLIQVKTGYLSDSLQVVKTSPTREVKNTPLVEEKPLFECPDNLFDGLTSELTNFGDGKLKGYGYVWNKKCVANRKPIPEDSIMVGYVHGSGWKDPILVGTDRNDGNSHVYAVEKKTLEEFYSKKGHLPSIVTQWDNSGSYLYVYSIEWAKSSVASV